MVFISAGINHSMQQEKHICMDCGHGYTLSDDVSMRV